MYYWRSDFPNHHIIEGTLHRSGCTLQIHGGWIELKIYAWKLLPPDGSDDHLMEKKLPNQGCAAWRQQVRQNHPMVVCGKAPVFPAYSSGDSPCSSGSPLQKCFTTVLQKCVWLPLKNVQLLLLGKIKTLCFTFLKFWSQLYFLGGDYCTCDNRDYLRRGISSKQKEEFIFLQQPLG